MSDDLRTFLILGGALSLYLIACLGLGAAPSKGGLMRRADNPGMYWFAIALPAAALAMMVLGGGVWALAQTANSHRG
jgi:hypothetical protein